MIVKRGIALIAAILAVAVGFTFTVSRAPADVLFAGADNFGTGFYGDQPSLTESAVLNMGTPNGPFKRLFSTNVTGQVYAHPVVAKNTMFIGTETNDIYGLDPVTGAVRWHRNLGIPWNPNDVTLPGNPCFDLQPYAGITATPVVVNGAVYFTDKTYKNNDSSNPLNAEYQIQAVNITTGQELPNFPQVVSGTPTNTSSPSAIWSPPGTDQADSVGDRSVQPAGSGATFEIQRAGLINMNGRIFIAFASMCDTFPWRGYIAGVNTDGSNMNLWSDEDSHAGGGIWQSGSPLISDKPGSFLFVTANAGAVPAPVGSVPALGTLGLASTPTSGLADSVVRVTVQGDQSLKATDFFTPVTADTVDDMDFSSGGVVALPSVFANNTYPHPGIVVGKDGYIYEVNLDNLGGRATVTDNNLLSKSGLIGGVWSTPAVWPGDGGYIWVPTSNPVPLPNPPNVPKYGALMAFKAGFDGSGHPMLTKVAQTDDPTNLASNPSGEFGFGSSIPIVTSNGTGPGTGLVWIIRADPSNDNATLQAYNAVPNNGGNINTPPTPVFQYNLNNTRNKFTAPVADGGRIYVVSLSGAQDGIVYGFGAANVSAPDTTTGPVGTHVTVSVSGLAASNTLSVTVGNHTAPILSGGKTDPHGTATVTFTVPSVPAGDQTIKVSDGTWTPTSPTAFTVISSVGTPNTTSGAPGTQVTVPVSGFAASHALSVTFGGVSAPLFSGGSTDATGSATVTIIVPSVPHNLNPFAIVVSDGTNSASPGTAFTVTAGLGTPNPAGGPIGTHVSVPLSGFSASSALSVKVGGATAAIVSGGQTDANGAGTVTFTVPSVPLGSEPIMVTDGSSVSASAPFTVGASVGTPSPTSGPTGTQVSVPVSGFAALHGLSVTVGGVSATIVSGIMTDASGAGTVSFTVPQVPRGAEAIVVTDGTGSASSGTPFTVTPSVGTPSPTSGLPGAQVTVQASGFAASHALSVGVGGLSATIVGGSVTDGHGSSAIRVQLPALPGGTYTLAVSDGSGVATTTVQVSPQAGLQISVTCPRRSHPGSRFTCVAHVNNLGPSAAGPTRISFSETGPRHISSRAVCSLTGLRIGQTAQCRVVFRGSRKGVYHVVATVGSTTPGRSGLRGTAVAVIRVG